MQLDTFFKNYLTHHSKLTCLNKFENSEKMMVIEVKKLFLYKNKLKIYYLTERVPFKCSKIKYYYKLTNTHFSCLL